MSDDGACLHAVLCNPWAAPTSVVRNVHVAAVASSRKTGTLEARVPLKRSALEKAAGLVSKMRTPGTLHPRAILNCGSGTC